MTQNNITNFTFNLRFGLRVNNIFMIVLCNCRHETCFAYFTTELLFLLFMNCFYMQVPVHSIFKSFEAVATVRVRIVQVTFDDDFKYFVFIFSAKDLKKKLKIRKEHLIVHYDTKVRYN